jgi:hypothetical protein
VVLDLFKAERTTETGPLSEFVRHLLQSI